MAEPLLTVDAETKAKLLDGSQWMGSVVAGVFTGILGYGAGVLVGATWSVPVGGLGAPRAGAVVGFLLPAVLVVGSTLNQVGAGFEFYEDRVVRSGGVLSSEEIPYDGVAFAVRLQSGGDTRSGAADFRLFREDEDDDWIENVADPDRVQEVLDEHLPSAEEWLEGRDDRDTAFRAFVHHRTELGADGEERAVYDPETLRERFTFEPTDLRLDELERINGVESFGDIETSDLRPNVKRE